VVVEVRSRSNSVPDDRSASSAKPGVTNGFAVLASIFLGATPLTSGLCLIGTSRPTGPSVPKLGCFNLMSDRVLKEKDLGHGSFGWFSGSGMGRVSQSTGLDLIHRHHHLVPAPVVRP
jgi:hypothetical protein